MSKLIFSRPLSPETAHNTTFKEPIDSEPQMATAGTPVNNEPHDDNSHGEFIAHHFENAEQQYDSGKLGIWAFLITEILFFSGLFVAYTLYRSHHPEIFAQAHVFLDKWLGGLNTVVLLFSSLTMALGVRAAQLGKNKAVTFYVLITMICAAAFIGVKAIEYSHKWDQGIFPPGEFDFTTVHAEPVTAVGKALHVSDYLVYLSAIPALLFVGFLVTGGGFLAVGKKNMGLFLVYLAITMGGYFLGALGAQAYMNLTGGGTGGAHASQPMLLHAQEHSDTAGAEPDISHEHGDGTDHADVSHGPDPTEFDRDIGIFFSIYYCMTGLHAIHIVCGIIALAWILWRSIIGTWRSDYFGPVDYVGLYWHLVDLIWIFLFPMLYLID